MLIVLYTLNNATQKWKSTIVNLVASKSHNLPEETCNVGDRYWEIQDYVRTNMSIVTSEGGDVLAMKKCKNMFNLYPCILRVDMSAFGKHTIRESRYITSLRNIIVALKRNWWKGGRGGYPRQRQIFCTMELNYWTQSRIVWRVLVDLHAIAIITSCPVPEEDSDSSNPHPPPVIPIGIY